MCPQQLKVIKSFNLLLAPPILSLGFRNNPRLTTVTSLVLDQTIVHAMKIHYTQSERGLETYHPREGHGDLPRQLVLAPDLELLVLL